VHISSINKLEDWATDIPNYAIKLAREFWPGPMTLILPRKKIVKDFITGGQNNVGLRVPAQPIALALLKKFEDFGGQGIAAPSANRFGAVSPTTAEAVNEELGNYFSSEDMVLDGGQCLVGIESTIIDCTKPKPIILRPGAITREMIESVIHLKVNESEDLRTVRASGLLNKHYSPNAQVVLDEKSKYGDGFIALSEVETPKGCIRLASPLNISEFGRDLYKALRLADGIGLSRVLIVVPGFTGLGEAINDRLLKASGSN
jgi:L-threonylcarbamoyladenylate synthase